MLLKHVVKLVLQTFLLDSYYRLRIVDKQAFLTTSDSVVGFLVVFVEVA